MRRHRREPSVAATVGSTAAGSARLLALFALALIVTLALSAPAASAAYTQVGEIGGTGPDGGNGSGSEDGQFANPGQLDVNDASGTLYVADTGNDRVQAFTPSETGGDFSAKVAITAPTGLAIDQSDGSVYVANASGVSKFDSGLHPVIVGWSEPGATGTLAVDPTSGDLLVADQGAGLIRRYESDGTAAGSFAAQRPLDLAVDSTGDVLVITSTGDLIDVCENTSSLIRFDSAGAEEGPVGSLTAPGQVDVDPDSDEVLVAAPVNSYNCGGYPAIAFLDSSGAEAGSFELPDAQFGYVPGLAARGNGSDRIYAVLRSPKNDFFVRTRVMAIGQIFPPEATIDPVTTFTATEAELLGTVDPNGVSTEYRFELSSDGGNTWDSLGTQSAGEGTDPVSVEATATNLDPNAAYQARLIATNQDGEATAGPESFQTPPLPPAIVKQSASTTVSEATMAARITTGNAATKYRFEYGPTAAYGKSTLEKTVKGSAGETSISATVGGLTPGAAYHFRVVIENSEGTDEGDDGTFTLQGVPAADTCPNAAIRAQQGTSHLPDCRAYEMVSPVDKNGFPIYLSESGGVRTGVTGLSESGEAAVFTSFGVFAGSPSGVTVTYRSQRGPTGWATRAVTPAPRAQHPDAVQFANVWEMASRELTTGVIETRDFFDPTDLNEARDVYQIGLDSEPELVSRGNGPERVSYIFGAEYGMASDGSASWFRAADHLVPEDADRGEGEADVYLRVGGKTELLNVDDEGEILSRCGSVMGTGWGNRRFTRSAVSDGAAVAVFTTPAPTPFASHPDCAEPKQIFARVGESTVHVSASERVPADPGGTKEAEFIGASRDGSKVFFASTEMLTNDAPDLGNALYVFDTDDETLELVPGTPGLNRAVAVSSDGSSVFFESTREVAHGGVEGRPNLYVAAGDGVSHIAVDQQGTSGDWVFSTVGAFGPNQGQVGDHALLSASDDGSTLVFLSATQLDPDFDNDGKLQAYLWREGSGLVCVSCDPAGQRPGASRPSTEVRLNASEVGVRVVSEDGSVVAFSSGDRLVPADTNNAHDVYQFSDGRLHLVSSGKGQYSSSLVGVSRDGRTIAFATAERLLPRDTDGGNLDMYVARTDGGFPEPAAIPASSCLGDSCQSARIEPPPASVASEAIGTAPSPKARKAKRAKRCAKAKPRAKRCAKRSAPKAKRGARRAHRAGESR